MPESPTDKSLPTLASELVDLLKTYVRQELQEPIKGIGRFLAFGLAGSVLLGIGLVVLSVALLRVLQAETGSVFDANWSWAPYLITVVACAAIIGLALLGTRKRGSRS